MDLAQHKPVTYIVPTQHVMEKAYKELDNAYVPFDCSILLYLKFHRDVLNQPASTTPLSLYEEMEDSIIESILRFNRDKDFNTLLESKDTSEVVTGWNVVNAIAKDLFKKLIKVEEYLGDILANSLPYAFYEYKCEPEWVRLYAGDMVVRLSPIKCLGVIEDV